MSETYVITAAQNATYVDKKWWKTLQHIVEFNNAELIVIPFYYRNGAKKNQWFDPVVKPYLLTETRHLGKHLNVTPIYVTPTAKNPLNSLATYCGKNSGCFGFPRLTLQSMVTSSNKARTLFTTGACTKANYSEKKPDANFNHQLACQIVHVDDKGYFHRREVEFKKGKAYDLRTLYRATGVEQNNDTIVMNPGDWHYNHEHQRNDGGYREHIKDVISELQVDYMLAHDFLDFRTQNHHSRDGKMRKIKIAQSPEFVKDELDGCCTELRELSQLTTKGVIVVESNHDKAYDRWLVDTNNFQNPIDAEFYHESWLRVLRNKGVSPFKLHYDLMFPDDDRVSFVALRDNFKINKTLIHHGDIGPSGARGSPTSFLKTADYSNSGHTHSPFRNFKVSVAGVTELEHGYNEKLGAWDQALCLIHKDGSVQIMHYVDGRIHLG